MFIWVCEREIETGTERKTKIVDNFPNKNENLIFILIDADGGWENDNQKGTAALGNH